MEEKTTIAYEGDNVNEIDLREMIYLYRKKFWRIVVALVAGALLVGTLSYTLVKPTYKATSKLYVVSASNNTMVNLADLQIGTTLAHDYELLILTRPMLESVIENLGLDMTPAELRQMITVTNPENTRILYITLTTTDPQLSADIANKMAELSVKWLPTVMESNAPNIAERAVVPTAKAAPHVTRSALLGGVISAILICVYYFIRFLIDDTIHTPEEMERCFGAMPLTTIPLEKATEKDTAYYFEKKGQVTE